MRPLRKGGMGREEEQAIWTRMGSDGRVWRYKTSEEKEAEHEVENNKYSDC